MEKGSLLTKLSAALCNDAEIVLYKSITGIDSAERLVELINSFCLRYLNSGVSLCHFVKLSIGASFGLRLEDGKDVFLKISRLRTEAPGSRGFSVTELNAMSQVQESLHAAGYPCPGVILHPVKFNDAIYTVNEFVDVGTQKDAHNSAIRRASAKGLARLITKARPFTGLSGFKEIDIYMVDSLYPAPHNPNTDFARNAENAGWIDEIAFRSKRLIAGIEKNVVLGHCDWSMKNMRFIDEDIVMVYDWDSLILQDECHILATAASTYPMTWDIPVRIVPTQDEAYDFVLAYEQARGKKFIVREWAKISASITYYFCYTARCQVSAGDEYEGSFIKALYNMSGDYYLQYL